MIVDDSTRAFVQGHFREYYASLPTLEVSHFARREWMMASFTGDVERHLAFPAPRDLADFLRVRVPSDVYHSVGWYQRPDAPTMDIKREGLLGANLLVDVDCKPGPPPTGFGTLAEALATAKRHALSALSILHDELGLRATDHQIRFSGGKGYHILCSSRILDGLDAAKRREIGALLGGAGVRANEVFPGGLGDSIHVPAIRPSSGLPGRMWTALHEIWSSLRSEGEAAGKASVGRATASQLVEAARGGETLADFLAREPRLASTLLLLARRTACVSVDQPVIGNTVGMVRLAGSLNSKTALRCTPIPNARDLERFDPVQDASPFPSREEVRIRGRQSCGIQTESESYVVERNEVHRLPMGPAMVFLASGKAQVAE